MPYETITVEGCPLVSHEETKVVDGVCTACVFDGTEPGLVVAMGERCEQQLPRTLVTEAQLDRALNRYTSSPYNWTLDRQTGEVGQFEVRLRFVTP